MDTSHLDRHRTVGKGTLSTLIAKILAALGARATLLTLFMFLALPAHADMKCEVDNTGKVLTAGILSIPMNAAPGTTVATLAPSPFDMRCYFSNGGTNNTSGRNLLDIQTTTALAAGFSDVYQTSVPGLGVRFTFDVGDCTQTSANFISPHDITCAFTGPLGGDYIYKNLPVTASFVVTGTIKAGASTITSGPLLTTRLQTTEAPTWWGKASLYTGSANGTLSTATCSVQTDALAVALPNITNRALSSGIGAAAGRTNFNLSFACASGAQVSIVVTDAVDPSNRSNVLTPAPDSTSKGVGVQILKDNNALVSFGPDAAGTSVVNQWLIGASPTGVLQLPLSAQYVRTGNVTPGSLRALATFTMSYQ